MLSNYANISDYLSINNQDIIRISNYLYVEFDSRFDIKK